MSEPTDPRIEAAARSFWKEKWDTYTDRQKNARRRIIGDMLKAAYQVAWQPIGGVVGCQLAALVEQGSNEGPYIGSCRNGVWCDSLDMVEPTHYIPLPLPPQGK